MATPALGLIKCSLFIQYYLLFRPLRWIRICVWIGAAVSVTFYVAVSITAFVLNSPWPKETFLEGILSWHEIKFANFSIPTGIMGMLVDWYLLILPIPAVLALQMSTARKIGVLVVFMTGGLYVPVPGFINFVVADINLFFIIALLWLLSSHCITASVYNKT